MARAVATNGYVNTSVADVLERAGVSRRTFYELFSDKEDCFLATLRAGVGRLQRVLSKVTTAAATEGQNTSDPLERFDRLIECYLQELADEPPLARTFLIEVYAAGSPALKERQAALERFVDMIAQTFAGSRGLLGDRPDQRFAVEALVGATSSMVTARVGAGEYERLAELREPLVDLAGQLHRQSPAP